MGISYFQFQISHFINNLDNLGRYSAGIVNYHTVIVLIGVHTWKAREGGQVCVEGGNWLLIVQSTIYMVPYGQGRIVLAML